MDPVVIAPVITVLLVFFARVLQSYFASALSVEVGSIKAEFERESDGVRRAQTDIERRPSVGLDSGDTRTHSEASTREPDGGRLMQLVGDLERIIQDRDRLDAELEERNEVLLKDYHAHGLAQSRVAFQFSLVFASLGFLLIAGSVVAALFQDARDATVPALVSGTVIEAVSGLFFVQSNRARAVMTSFFEKARVDRSLTEALRLAEEVPDPLIRSRLQTVLSLRLAKAEATDDVLRTVMTSLDAAPRSTPSVAAEESPSRAHSVTGADQDDDAAA